MARQIVVDIIGDSAKFTKATRDAMTSTSKFLKPLDDMVKRGGIAGSVMQGVGQSVGQMLNPLSLATKAFDMVTQGIGMTVSGLTGLGRAYREDAAEQAQLNNTLMRNVEGWQNYTGAIDDAIAAGQRLAFSDSEQRLSLGKLITATRDARKAITLNRLAMDIARQRNIKLAVASDAVTKAARGQYKGLKSLGYIVDSTADSTQVLADVTLQAADSADTWAKTAQGKFAARLMAIGEAAENNGAAFARLDGINKDLALSTLETGNTMVMYGGILMDFLGIGKDAEGQTIAQAQAFDVLGQSVEAIGWKYNKMATTVRKDYGDVAKSVDWATSHMNQSMSDFLGPWRQQWKDAAEWAKDPFRPDKFERWIARRAEKAIANAEAAAKDGKPGVASRWRAIAAALKSPVITAVGEIKTSIADVIAAMAVIDGVKSTLGNYSRNGSSGHWVAGHWKQTKNGVKWVDGHMSGDVGHNASGTSNWKGGWTWVGENGPELMNLPGGTRIKSNAESMRAAGGASNAYTINVNVAPGGDLVQTGRQIVEAIRQFERRSGAVWRS